MTLSESATSTSTSVERDRQHLPLVSIGIPVYNGEAYLAQAVLSATSQTVEDIEIIISDNASTDGTEELARQLAAADSRVSYIRHSRNHGASAALITYCAWLVGNISSGFALTTTWTRRSLINV